MKNRIIFVLLILIYLPSYAQTNQYMVITFEAKRSIDKEVQKYYWIAPVDSIKNTEFRLYPLYLVVGEFSKDNLDDSQKGDSIDIFVSTANTRLDFDNEYEIKVNNLISFFQSFVYLPLANFDYASSFWQTSTAAIVKFSNYSYIDYKSHLLHKKGVQSGDK